MHGVNRPESRQTLIDRPFVIQRLLSALLRAVTTTANPSAEVLLRCPLAIPMAKHSQGPMPCKANVTGTGG